MATFIIFDIGYGFLSLREEDEDLIALTICPYGFINAMWRAVLVADRIGNVRNVTKAR